PEISIDAITAGFTFLVTLLTGLVFGIVPALGSLGFGVRDALQRESRSASVSTPVKRTRQALVILQLALSLTLLIGAGLLAKTFLQLRTTHPGFRVENVLTARVNLRGQEYSTPDTRSNFMQRMLEQISALPGVDAAAVTSAMPVGPGGNFGTVRVE